MRSHLRFEIETAAAMLNTARLRDRRGTCALHYVRKVYKNNSVRLHGQGIDIPKRPNSKYASYAGKHVVVKHLLSGDYRAFYGEECIAWANGSRPKPFNHKQPKQRPERRASDTFTEQLRGDIFT